MLLKNKAYIVSKTKRRILQTWEIEANHSVVSLARFDFHALCFLFQTQYADVRYKK